MSAVPKAAGSFADLLPRPVERTAAPTRVNRLERPDESEAHQLRERIMGVVMKDAGTTAKALAELLEEDVEDVRNACGTLRAAGRITAVAGEGYYLNGRAIETTPKEAAAKAPDPPIDEHAPVGGDVVGILAMPDDYPLLTGKDQNMKKKTEISTKSQRFVEHLTKLNAWVHAGAIATALDESIGNTKYHLKNLLEAGAIQAAGTATKRMFAALGVKAAAADAAPPAEKTSKAKRRPAKAVKKKAEKKTKRKARTTTPANESPTSTGARFGFFSDGSLIVECADCKGTLSEADLVALREFTKRFEDRP